MNAAPTLTVSVEERLWFVAFPLTGAPQERTAWWQRPLRPGFRHCFALRAEGGDRTLVADHLGARLVIELLRVPLVDALANLRRQLGALILAANEPATPLRPRVRGPMSCVEMCKALLGIRACWIVTPRQLWRHLRARGARVIV
jgi:hypothetical protein